MLDIEGSGLGRLWKPPLRKRSVLRRFRAYRLIVAFKFFAILDILFKDKFELKAWNKHGLEAKTKYWKKEIIDAADNGSL